MFERIVKTRVFQQKLQKLKDFINTYFDIMYKDEDSPINQAALRIQLSNIARLTNYYDDLSDFYTDHTKIMITKEKFQSWIAAIVILLTLLFVTGFYRGSAGIALAMVWYWVFLKFGWFTLGSAWTDLSVGAFGAVLAAFMFFVEGKKK